MRKLGEWSNGNQIRLPKIHANGQNGETLCGVRGAWGFGSGSEVTCKHCIKRRKAKEKIL